MRWLEHRVPPPIVALLLAGAMWPLSQLLPRIDAPPAVRLGLAVLIGVSGLGISLAGTIAFHRARTTVNPLSPHKASALVTGGIYRVTRNPMYLGMMLGLLCWAVGLGSPAALAGPVAFIAYINRFQIEPEERALRAKFGAAYDAYCARVRRWV